MRKYLYNKLFLQHLIDSLSLMNSLLVPACYLPPVAYFAQLQQHVGAIWLDAHEHFIKQTYRSRATIATANGALDLIVPVDHQKKGHTPMKDVRISTEFAWQRLHWMSIQTAYRRSAYFEYYEDDFSVFYEKKWSFLYEFNVALTELILKRLKLPLVINPTTQYEAPPFAGLDLRGDMSPKQAPPYTQFPEYYQVFAEKNGFIANLSIIDLLFNQGPQSVHYFPTGK